MLDGIVGVTAVWIDVVRHVGGLECRASTFGVGIRFVVFLHLGDGFFSQIASSLPGAFRKRACAIGLFAPSLAVITGVMINFADGNCFIAVILEVFRQGQYVGHGLAERRVEVVNFGCIWPGTAEQAGPRRGANSLLAISPLKEKSFGSQAIDVR